MDYVDFTQKQICETIERYQLIGQRADYIAEAEAEKRAAQQKERDRAQYEKINAQFGGAL